MASLNQESARASTDPPHPRLGGVKGRAKSRKDPLHRVNPVKQTRASADRLPAKGTLWPPATPTTEGKPPQNYAITQV